MARFKVTGLEEIIKDMDRLGQQVGPVADEMLQAGAAVVQWEWQKAISNAGLIDTGDMFASVRPTKPKETGGVKSLTVYPQGKDSTGTRNAEKAFIGNYGREQQPATHFADKAEENAEAPAQAAMEAVWDRFITSA